MSFKSKTMLKFEQISLLSNKTGFSSVSFSCFVQNGIKLKKTTEEEDGTISNKKPRKALLAKSKLYGCFVKVEFVCSAC